jgi:AcrR family transcriptional regulator
MSIVVEHEKRRYEILEKALDVFIEEGFNDATFQKIADRCSITRTTLYIYFKNKREIFNFSIKQFLSLIERDVYSIINSPNLSHTEKLVQVMFVIVEQIQGNRRLLSVILNHFIYMSKGDYDPNERVRRRTVRMRKIMAGMIIEGKKAGEFSPRLNVKDAGELLYAFFESAIFRMVVLRHKSVQELKEAVRLAVNGFASAK